MWYAPSVCGRYVQTQRARDHARLLAKREAMPPSRTESWNVAPTTASLLVRQDAKGFVRDWLIWGFLDQEQIPKFFNAKLETASEKPLFKDAWRESRCVVPADGWYEWQERGGQKQPYFFHLPDRSPLFLAGLWQRRTFVLLTMDAGALTPYHGRRPVSLGIDEAKQWIYGMPTVWKDVARTALPDTGFGVHPVSLLVNKAGTDGPDLIEPVTLLEEPPKLEQTGLW